MGNIHTKVTAKYIIKYWAPVDCFALSLSLCDFFHFSTFVHSFMCSAEWKEYAIAVDSQGAEKAEN